VFGYSDFYFIGKESYRRNISVLQLRVENGKTFCVELASACPNSSPRSSFAPKMHTLKGRQLSSVIIQNFEERQAS
jgi:hypothetical protein